MQTAQHSNHTAFMETTGRVATILKPDKLKSGLKSTDFNWQIQDGSHFDQYSNGWASRFQIPFKTRLILSNNFFYVVNWIVN